MKTLILLFLSALLETLQKVWAAPSLLQGWKTLNKAERFVVLLAAVAAFVLGWYVAMGLHPAA